MVTKAVGYILLVFVLLGPTVIAAAGGDASLAVLIFVTTLVTLALGVLGAWLIVKGSPPPREWEKS